MLKNRKSLNQYINNTKIYESIIDEDTSPEDVDVSSFKIKDELCPDFWNGDNFNIYARKRLLSIAKDFLEGLEIDDYIDDIVITGSLANYNWDNEYSDIDLHIIIDFSLIDGDKKILKRYFDAERKNWNSKHSELTIFGYPVEIYVQDINEYHKSSGVFSLLHNKWITKPSIDKLSTKNTDFNDVQNIVSDFMNKIDELSTLAEYEEDSFDIYKKAKELFNDIKEIRKKGMISKYPEMSTGNLIFKSLRRNGYIEKLLDIRGNAYDLFNSL